MVRTPLLALALPLALLLAAPTTALPPGLLGPGHPGPGGDVAHLRAAIAAERKVRREVRSLPTQRLPLRHWGHRRHRERCPVGAGAAWEAREVERLLDRMAPHLTPQPTEKK